MAKMIERSALDKPADDKISKFCVVWDFMQILYKQNSDWLKNTGKVLRHINDY